VDKPFNRRTIVDPAVADMLSDMEKKRRIASLPKSKQEKARKDASRHRVGLDLPPELHESLRKIAEQEHISVSGLVTFYLLQSVAHHETNMAELAIYKRPSRCARFDYVLELSKMEKS
jgi:hypothetical protein